MSRLRLIFFASAGFLLTSSFAAALQEGAAAPAADDGGGGTDIMAAIQAAGIIGYLIIAMSMVAGALIIEHFTSIKRDKLAPPETVDEIEELLAEGNYQEALDLCEAEPCFFTNVAASGIRKIGHPFEALEKSVEEMEDEESVKLQQKIGWLSLIAGIGPMMGLFGTVTGMVGAFATIADASGGVEPSEFAGDISMALMTTVLGLTVAIPTTGFYAFFKNKVTITSLEIGAMIEEMFERFRPTE
ncbi:MAG: MotA/TolQ/ExbB proton channel family protein [Planctomycetes bacterium]|nr:MotA/TolQ/ExbB proton channel family protein [Planctomycetota bacterium]